MRERAFLSKIFLVLLCSCLLACEAQHDESLSSPSGGGADGRFTQEDLAAFMAGQETYNQKCLTCHNALESSPKRNRKQSQITAAVQTVPIMSGIVLNSVELKNLEFALSVTLKEIQDDLAGRSPDGGSDPEPITSSLEVIVPKATNTLLVSKFKALFIDSANPHANDTLINTKLESLITQKPHIFGGFCNELDGSCAQIENSFELSKNSKNLTSASTLRSGLLARTCSEVIIYDSALLNVLKLVNLTPASSITESSLKSVWNEMIPNFEIGESVSEQNVLSALLSLRDEALSKGQTLSQQWKAVVTSICESPLMEAI